MTGFKRDPCLFLSHSVLDLHSSNFITKKMQHIKRDPTSEIEHQGIYLARIKIIIGNMTFGNYYSWNVNFDNDEYQISKR